MTSIVVIGNPVEKVAFATLYVRLKVFDSKQCSALKSIHLLLLWIMYVVHACKPQPKWGTNKLTESSSGFSLIWTGFVSDFQNHFAGITRKITSLTASHSTFLFVINS